MQRTSRRLNMPPSGKILLATWTLRVIGASICMSVIAIFMPPSWIEAAHQLLGFGQVPRGVIFPYMARTLSAMYFAHGVMVLGLSTDVVRYRPLVFLVGLLNVGLGGTFLGVDLYLGMPLFWTLLEGPPIFLGGIWIVWLGKRLK